MEYNANREFKDYNPKQGGYMAEARRKTTFEERKEIVSYCISHSRNYKDAATKYDVILLLSGFFCHFLATV